MSEPLVWSTVTVTGPDATTFLDGQLTQDLSSAQGVWSLLLEPTGTVITVMWVRPRHDGWDLLVPRELAEESASRLARFKIRVRCAIAVEEDVTDEPLTTTDDLFTARTPWVAELNLHLAPHSYGATFVERTISFTKGCFTGQELVGRMDARGATMPWRFVRAIGPTADEIDGVLRGTGPDGPHGVTRSRSMEDGVEALGFAHRTLLGTTAAASIALEAIE